MTTDPVFGWSLPYASKRQPVLAGDVVATSQPLAAQAGLDALARGGTAVDAAVTAAATLTVVEPTSNGIGGDLFALLWDPAEGLCALNASGRAPAGLDVARLHAAETMPLRGWDSVTVPGAVSGWMALSQRFGTLDFSSLLEPAVRYAMDGFAVSPVTAAAWALAPETYGTAGPFAETFLPDGRAPTAGQRVRFPDHARTLARIAETDGADFYTGPLADAIVASAKAAAAPLSAGDLAGHTADWVEPIEQDYREVRVHELPPNSQGLIALIALGLLERSALADAEPGSPAWFHAQIEATKLAIADGHAFIADPAAMDTDPAAFLDDGYLTERAALIDPDWATVGAPGKLPGGGTVYLATADSAGRMCSLIQSNYYGFGSGVVVPGTGIALHNRGAGFSTDPAHPNVVGPGKRPFHTIIPGFLSEPVGESRRSVAPLAAIGVMGGPMQPQGHVQLVTRTIDGGENPQAAIDAPRWRVEPTGELALEARFDGDIAASLETRGHRIVMTTGDHQPLMGGFGGAQLVWRLGVPEGATPALHLGASDPRKDGQALGR